MKLTGGFDEAGRGALIGPQVCALIFGDEVYWDHVRSVGIKDSKKYSSKVKLLAHAQAITSEVEGDLNFFYNVFYIPSTIIDSGYKDLPPDIYKYSSLALKKPTINQLTYDALYYLLVNSNYNKKLGQGSHLYIDRISGNPENYIPKTLGITFKEYPKADSTYIECSAASVIAKSYRETYMDQLSLSLTTDIGSGYPTRSVKAICSDLVHNESKYEDILVREVRKTWVKN